MTKESVSAVVLAGGGSTRMGQNKALLQLGDKTMIERIIEGLKPLFNEIIVITNHPEEYPMIKDILFVKDEMKLEEKNSLVGIYTGLLAAKNPYAFIVPCDMPFLDQNLIQHMLQQLEGEDIVIPFIEGHYQPLHAIYGKGCIEPIKELLEKRRYKITSFFGQVKIKTIDEETIMRFSKDMKCFLNVNTYDAYLKIQEDWK
ncbi:molybdenum cofactor guanylyltransferase [Natronincola peptidivorans]|uniref:Probable molybdenum cofactor guanylyltransferase n=1 Tax=Natronincola peptidivorans TaxID=426128 RepID=A0A1I0D4U7_9FIRM|nr:molybdenum cofactor guanylyltransferase [Natronincola peptidivorans]SET27277.1 molybdenum cofactor guanylyltransferase [Natronincola peptidivorans]